MTRSERTSYIQARKHYEQVRFDLEVAFGITQLEAYLAEVAAG